MGYQTIEVRKVTPVIGAEVHGVDLTKSLGNQQFQEIHDALLALGRPVELHVIEAPYGHDCFLLEEAAQTPIIRTFLGRPGMGGQS